MSSNEASEAEDIEDSQESDDASGTKYLIRESNQAAMDSSKDNQRAPKRAAKAQAGQRAEMPLNREINLNRLSSISGAGGNGGKKSADRDRGGQANIECYNCGGKGHISLDCPNPGRKRRLEYDGAGPRKRPKEVETLDY